MKKNYSITVKGKEKTWSFNISADPKHVEDWRADGLQIDELVYTIPEWIVDIGLMKPYIFFIDIFNFRNPWRK